MENSILDKIFNSESEIFEKLKQKEDYEELYEEGYEDYDKLMAILNDEQKDYLQKFAEAQFAQKCKSDEAYFKEGIKFGVRLLLECLSD